MISTLNPQLDPIYADFWGEFLPFALEGFWPIVKAGCYVPRWFQAPTDTLSVMAVGDYNEYSLQIPAGSFILSILHSIPVEIGGGQPSGGGIAVFSGGTFNIQITDTSIDHKWFSNPMPDALFFKNPSLTGRNGHVLPKPYPVISPGNFLIERWCTGAGPCEVVLACAVPEGS